MPPSFAWLAAALDALCRDIEHSALSQALQSIPWAAPTLQTMHLLAIAALMSAMLLINLRLAGVHGTARDVGEVLRTLRPVMAWALPVLLVSGVLLIINEPARTLKNATFQWKMLLLVCAMMVTRIQFSDIHTARRVQRRGAVLGLATLSMSLWVGIVFAGRWLAYT
jgi:hypothetical protein